MIVPVLLFILGLALLIKGGDWFVEGATGIAHKLHIPELIIGATVVSIGTTLPEVMVSATSALKGYGGIAYGNAIGSIICNTSLVAALTIAIRPSGVDRKTFLLPCVFFWAAAVFYTYVSARYEYFSRVVGILLLAMFAVYMIIIIYRQKKMPLTEQESVSTEPETIAKNVFFLVLGAALIAFGSNLLVNNGTVIAEALGIPESVIALTFVALGTSLPELVTAVTSLVKGHSALSLGNIIGANLFNLVLVSGVSVTLSPFSLPNNKLIWGVNSSLVLDLPVMIFVMLVLTLPALIRQKVSRVQGIVLLMIYAAFCVVRFTL